jgi:hypothetical protein
MERNLYSLPEKNTAVRFGLCSAVLVSAPRCTTVAKLPGLYRGFVATGDSDEASERRRLCHDFLPAEL